MQTAGDLVTTSAELAAGVEHGEHRLQRAFAGAGVHIRRDAAAVVADRSGAVLPQHHQNPIAMTGQGLVHRVVHHFVHQVMETPRPRGADVHARALADGLKALQHLDLLSAVGVLNLGCVAHAESLKPETGLWAAQRALNLGLAMSIYHRLSRESSSGLSGAVPHGGAPPP